MTQAAPLTVHCSSAHNTTRLVTQHSPTSLLTPFNMFRTRMLLVATSRTLHATNPSSTKTVGHLPSISQVSGSAPFDPRQFVPRKPGLSVNITDADGDPDRAYTLLTRSIMDNGLMRDWMYTSSFAGQLAR